MNKIKPLKRAKLSDEVTKAIENIIIDNNLQPGEKLPSQSELCNSLNVGSRSVREAIRSLESRGLVETKQGKGVFVINSNMDFFLEMLKTNLVFQLPKELKTLVDLANIRMMIETDVIYNIADSPPGELIPILTELIEKMEEKADNNDIEAYNILDVEFHKAIIKASGNDIIISIYNHLFELLVNSFQKTGGMKGSKETSRKEHRKMLEAIKTSDSKKAREIMTRHINSTLSKLKKMQEQAEVEKT